MDKKFRQEFIANRMKSIKRICSRKKKNPILLVWAFLSIKKNCNFKIASTGGNTSRNNAVNIFRTVLQESNAKNPEDDRNEQTFIRMLLLSSEVLLLFFPLYVRVCMCCSYRLRKKIFSNKIHNGEHSMFEQYKNSMHVCLPRWYPKLEYSHLISGILAAIVLAIFFLNTQWLRP